MWTKIKYWSILYNRDFHRNIIKLIKEAFTKLWSYIDKVLIKLWAIQLILAWNCSKDVDCLQISCSYDSSYGGKHPKYIKIDDFFFHDCPSESLNCWTDKRKEGFRVQFSCFLHIKYINEWIMGISCLPVRILSLQNYWKDLK